MQDHDPSWPLPAPMKPWLDWLDAQSKFIELSLEWQRNAWQPWLDWQASAAMNGMDQLGWPWLVRGEEELG